MASFQLCTTEVVVPFVEVVRKMAVNWFVVRKSAEWLPLAMLYMQMLIAYASYGCVGLQPHCSAPPSLTSTLSSVGGTTCLHFWLDFLFVGPSRCGHYVAISDGLASNGSITPKWLLYFAFEKKLCASS